jgi:hypothetical protein
MEFPFSLIAGHVLCEMDGQRVLVDTGSPESFGRVRAMRFLGALTALPPFPSGGPSTTVDTIAAEIRALPGAPPEFSFDVLLGCDVLAGCGMTVDWDRSLLSLNPLAPGLLLPPAGVGLTRLPRIWTEVNGHGFRAFADTGARLSYVVPEHVAAAPPVGTERDFLMGAGAFDTTLVSVGVTLGDRSLDARVGVAGGDVLRLLRATKMDGIVGTDLMSRCGKTRFLFGRPVENDGDVAAPAHPSFVVLRPEDGALVIRAETGPEMLLPRAGEEDLVSDVTLTFGVLGMVLGDRPLYDRLLKRFLSGGKA